MVTRIKRANRRNDRGSDVVGKTPATHIIKIGWKGTRGGQGQELPLKLNGFLICRDDVDPQSKRMRIDYPAMERLGYLEAQIKMALQKHWHAPDECLPHKLRFIIMADARREEDAWVYPRTMSEGYQCYTRQGLYCHGDGQHASRKADKGGRVQLECVPVGKAGANPSDYCPYSVAGDCRYNFRLTVCLYYTGPDGRPTPLSPELGESARYRLDSTSEFAGPEAFAQLDAAADRVRGLLNGITGTMTFQPKWRHTGTGRVIVGHVLIQLDEASIRAKEAKLAEQDLRRANYRLEAARAGAPQLTYEPQVIDIEPEPAEPAASTEEPTKQEPAEPEPIKPAETVESDEIHEDDPFGPEPEAEPEPEPEPEPAGIDDADPQYLADALEAYAESRAVDEERTIGAIVRELAINVDERTRRYAGQMEGADWFLGGEGKGYDNRVEVLREICRRLDQDDRIGFAITPQGEGES